MRNILFTLSLILLNIKGPAQTAYITNSQDNTVSVIDVRTDKVFKTIPVGNGPNGVAVSPDGARVYIGNISDSTVSVINTATNAVSATIKVGYYPAGLAVLPNGTKVYVTNYNDNTISVIDASTNTVSKTITCRPHPFGIAVSPDGSKIYVANDYDASVTVISTTSDAIINIIFSLSLVQATGLCVSPDGARVYVTRDVITSDTTITVIDCSADTVLTSIKGESGPEGIAISPDGSKVYVANFDIFSGNTVSVINTATNSVSATIPVGSGPLGISVTPDGTEVYVVDFNLTTGGGVSVINSATNTVTATIATGNQPVGFGNFISAFTYIPMCTANFTIEPDTTQIHHYIAKNYSVGRPPLRYHWDWGDSWFDTIPYPSHTYYDAGFYDICLTVTDSTGGCESTFCDSSFHALRTTNTMVYVNVINPLTATQNVTPLTWQVNIYPNPFTSQTTVEFRDEQKNTTIKITDLLGNEIKTTSFTGKQLTIEKGEMSRGIYFVRIVDDKNNVVNKKIIVQ